MLYLVVKRGPRDVGKEVALPPGTSLILGRSEEADFQLLSSGVSKLHCRVTALPGSKLEIEDLSSVNGTHVNGLLIKKHSLRPGESFVIHTFVLQVQLRAPEVEKSQSFNAGFASDGNAAFDLRSAPGPEAVVAAPPQGLGEKLAQWFENNVFPWADLLSSRFDVRALLGFFLLSWSVLLVLFTAWPFSHRANLRVQEQAVQVARLYARQLVRVNQQAIVNQQYKDLVGSLDAKAGQTPGVITSMILDVKKAQVLAPPENLGLSIQNLGEEVPPTVAAAALSREEEGVYVDGQRGLAYVSEPIKVGTAEGNITVATALVVFDTLRNQFSFAALLDQAVTSLLYALLASFVLLLFVYRWVEGSLLRASDKIDEALKKSETSVANPVRWPALSVLLEQVSFALGRSDRGLGAFGGGSSQNESGEWALAAVAASSQAAAALSLQLQVSAWNANMERIIGIRSSQAIGAEISEASRDVAFESAVRSLASEAQATLWSPVSKELEFSGINHRLTLVAGSGAIFLTLAPVES